MPSYGHLSQRRTPFSRRPEASGDLLQIYAIPCQLVIEKLPGLVYVHPLSTTR